MSTGYEVYVYKSESEPGRPADGPPIRVPRSVASSKVWKKIAEVADIALGVTALAMELAWDNPTVKPPDIKTEWRKAGGSDPSKRHAHTVGTERSGASAPGSVIERISADDLPLSLWIWQNAPRTKTGTAPDPDSDVLMTKVIVKAWNPLAQIVSSIDGR